MPPLLIFFFKGTAIGLSIAAPVGPIGVLCIRRTLQQGRLAGLACGLGAAAADTAYGAVAAFGLTAVSGALVAASDWLTPVGGAFLCILGLRTLRTAPAGQPAPAGAAALGSAFGTTFLLTLANPMTILSFAAVFAGFGLARTPGFAASGALVAGVCIGSALWWLFLTTAVSHLHRRISDGAMRRINRASGAMILGFGVYALASWAAG